MTKRTKTALLFGLILVLLFAAGLFGFFYFFERAEKQIHTPASEKARKNPYLAAARFLEKIGIQAEPVHDRNVLLHPPSPADLVFVHRMGADLSKNREKRLISWIRQGGHLVITARRQWDENKGKSGNRILDRFGVRLHAENTSPSKEKTAGRVSTGGETTFRVAFDPERTLEDSKGIFTIAARGEAGVHALQKTMGKGKLTVLSDSAYWTNSRIGRHDHAFFLARTAGGARKAWLIQTGGMPPIGQLIWKHAPHFVVCVLVLAVTAVLRAGMRIGPLIRVEHAASRNIMEHLRASGRYLWRTRNGSLLFKSVQETVERRLRMKYRIGGAADRERLSRIISRKTGLSARAVYEALYSNFRHDPRSVVRTISVLQKLNRL